MIKSCQLNSGFLSFFPHVKGRKYEFNDKFNVIFGENGIGKSALMKTMAAHCGIEKGGWSSISEPSKLAVGTPNQFPKVYRQYAPGQCGAILDWDGTPTFYNDSDSVSKSDMSWFYSSASQSNDGLTTEAEQMDIAATKPSSGQFRIHKINKIMSVIQHPPNLLVVPPHIQDKTVAQWEANYIKTLPRNGKVTLLLDEPEKALALPKQLELFEVLHKLSAHFQVIVVTHSPFILFFKDANIIDMMPGYSKICKELIKKQVKVK